MIEHSDKIGILAFVPDLWQSSWQSRHHILHGLSKQYKVLWVSPPTYFEAIRAGRGQTLITGRGVHKISDSLWTYAPRIPADYKPSLGQRQMAGWRNIAMHSFQHYHRLWQKAYVARIKHLLKQMGIERIILYIWRPEYGWSQGEFSELLTCYHIDDEYSFDPTMDAPVNDTEMMLLKQSDLIFIHSKTMMEKKGRINPNTYYVPNGVDFDHFQKVMGQLMKEPDDLKQIPSPRLGYVGYLKRHLDLPLLLMIARQRRDWSIVLVGPIHENHHEIMGDIAQLKQEPNVYFLGRKPYSDLPTYIRGFDVCLMNYKQTAYTKYIYPVKLHEYLACGKPVVATSLVNVQEFSEVLYFAKGINQWVLAIEQALNEDSHELSSKRIKVAQKNSWASRIQVISLAIEEAIVQ